MDGQENNLVYKLKDLYDKFMTAMQIDKKTGIVCCENKHAKEDQPWRFATMPYVGKYYGCAKPKILFIGLDMGCDIKYEANEYLNFDERHDTILRISKNKKQDQSLKYNPHIAGTYALSLAILSQNKKEWQPAWEKLAKEENTKNKFAIYNNKDDLPKGEDNVLEYIGLTNLFKFVTVGRKKAKGPENRQWIDDKKELTLLKEEIKLFNPDVIILQGKDFNKFISKEIVKSFTDEGIILIKGRHPSAYKGGWDKILGVKKHLNQYMKKLTKQQKAN